jgi:hypothetical protein
MELVMQDDLEFCHGGGCVLTERKGEKVTLSGTRTPELGALAVLSLSVYRDRVQEAYFSGDPTVMFDSPEQYSSLTSEELDAYGTYIGTSLLTDLVDGDRIVAFSDGRTIQVQEEVIV